MSKSDALETLNLLPLWSRRHISALGALHRRVLERMPSIISELLPLATPQPQPRRTRLMSNLYNHQLVDPINGRETLMFKRSIFGYICIYNRLPQDAVDAKSVKVFQNHLVRAYRLCATRDFRPWDQILSFENRTMDIAKFHSYFAD